MRPRRVPRPGGADRGGGAPAEAAASGGFSLVEALVALVVVGLLAAVGIPGVQRLRVVYGSSSAVRELADVHERARSEALRRHSQVGVAYDQGRRTVTVFEDRDRAGRDAPGNTNGALDLGEEVIARVDLATVLRFARPSPGAPVDVGGSTVLYRADGTPRPGLVTDPAVYLADAKLNYFRVRVNRVTGLARVEKWDNRTTWSARREDWQWQH